MVGPMAALFIGANEMIYAQWQTWAFLPSVSLKISRSEGGEGGFSVEI